MTIKQQGGIFGRNPTFNEVSATDAEITNQLDVKTISMVSNNPLIYLDDTDVADNNTRLRNQSGIFRIQDVTDDGSTTTQVQLAHSTGDLTVSTGNLVIGTSGKGIDFSATSGTGTSELFSDYEEGTWTPTYTTDGTDFDSVNYDSRTHGRYVKIGSLVYVSCLVYTDGITVGSASGDVLIGGLPYTSSNDPSNAATYAGAVISSAFAGDMPSEASVDRNATTIRLNYRATSNGASVNLQVADMATSANDNYVQLSFAYRV